MNETEEIANITQEIVMEQTKIHTRQADMDRIFSEAGITRLR